jgi:broad specificity phosphatase PhoE
MQRTRQTASYLEEKLGITAVVEDRLREVGNALPDGKVFPDDKLPRYILGVWGSLHPYLPITEGGENWMHFRARVGGFIEWAIQQIDGNPVECCVGVVCHGGVIEGVFEHVFQKGPVSPVVVHSHNTGVTRLEFNPTEGMPDWKLYYHNRTAHLQDDQIT